MGGDGTKYSTKEAFCARGSGPSVARRCVRSYIWAHRRDEARVWTTALSDIIGHNSARKRVIEEQHVRKIDTLHSAARPNSEVSDMSCHINRVICIL